MSKLYADYLLAKKYYEEAALLYERSKCVPEALHAWERALNWRYCIALAKSSNLGALEFQQLCDRLVEQLKNASKHRDAAEVIREFQKNDEEAVVALLDGHLWSEAYLLAKSIGRNDLIGKRKLQKWTNGETEQRRT